MQIGISTASLFDRLDNEHALPYLSSQGIPCAEVFLTSFSEYSKEFGELLAKGKGQVRVHSVHDLNTQFEPQLFNTNQRVKKDAFDWLEKVMQAGVALGAKYYTFHGIARVKRSSHSGKNDNFPYIQQGFWEIYEFCQKFGIKLCLENVEWASYNRVGVFSKIRERVPEIGGVLDIKQARISGYDYRDYLTEMGQNLTHVHISDIDENGKICLPCKGVFDFDELVCRLADIGFNGPLIIEVYKDSYKHANELKPSFETMSELLYKHNLLDK